MSLDYFVVCREPLPARLGGWDFQVGPVRVEDAGEASREARRAAGVAVAEVLSLRGQTRSESLLEGAGLLLAQATRGVVVRAEGLSVLEDCRELPPTRQDAAGLEGALRDLTAEPTAPSGAAASNGEVDWSDVA